MSRRSLAVSALGFIVVGIGACTLQRTPAGGRSSALQSAPMDDHMAHMSAADIAAATRAASNATQQGVAGLPASNLTAEARLKASPRHAEWVKIPWGDGKADSLMAWIVYPASPNARAKAPVVVVVHEIYGLSTWVRGVADQVAADGFIAIAPDMLSRVRGGPSATELASDTATKLIRGVSNAERSNAVSAAANYAMMQPSATQKYAVIGYCWGGSTSWYHAINGGVKGFSAAVPFYGLPYTTGGTPATATTAAVAVSISADSLAKVKVPVMMMGGSKDARIGAAMPAVDSIMKSLKKEYSGTNYEGAVHGFLRAQDDPKAKRDEAEEAANLTATKDGWPRMIAFLKKNMSGK